MSLATVLDLTLRWRHSNALDLSTVEDNGQLNLSDTLADGVVIDTADKKFTDTRSLAATSENLDLAGGLTDAFGATITFAKIKAIIIKNNSTTPGENLTIGGHATAAFPLFSDVTDKYVLGPNGVFLIWEPSLAGKTVTATTGDLLKIDSGAATISYTIIIIGTSA